MKKIFAAAALLLLMSSCKKDETQPLHRPEKPLRDSTPKTSLGAPDHLPLNAPQIKGTDEKPAPGKAVFTQNNRTLFSFNHTTNKGSITINNITYPLDSFLFQENGYEISGKSIKISALEGDFQEMKSDCLYGNFPEISITLGTEKLMLTAVNVQDCQSY